MLAQPHKLVSKPWKNRSIACSVSTFPGYSFIYDAAGVYYDKLTRIASLSKTTQRATNLVTSNDGRSAHRQRHGGANNINRACKRVLTA